MGASSPEAHGAKQGLHPIANNDFTNKYVTNPIFFVWNFRLGHAHFNAIRTVMNFSKVSLPNK